MAKAEKKVPVVRTNARVRVLAEPAAESAASKFPRRTAKKERTRQRILAVASEQFRASGFGATSMQNIADAADIHLTTLFTHFRTKNEIAISLTTSSVEKLRELVSEAKGKTPFFEFFRTIVWSSANAIKNESDPTMTLWSELRNDHELAFAWSQYEEAQRDLFADYIAHEYKLDRRKSYLPDMISALLVTSTLLPHKKWVESPRRLSLLDEVSTAIDLSEKTARDMLRKAKAG